MHKREKIREICTREKIKEKIPYTREKCNYKITANEEKLKKDSEEVRQKRKS